MCTCCAEHDGVMLVWGGYALSRQTGYGGTPHASCSSFCIFKVIVLVEFRRKKEIREIRELREFTQALTFIGTLKTFFTNFRGYHLRFASLSLDFFISVLGGC